MALTIEEILKGTGVGPMQSVGQMQVIPLIGTRDSAADDTFAPPELEVATQGYGSVTLRNVTDKPTIVPNGAGWVVLQRARDHAIGSGALLRPNEQKVVSKAMCIQQTQAGLISSAKHEMQILPAPLRAKALAMRHVDGYSKLWQSIVEWNKSVGLAEHAGNLVAFLRGFASQLDEFVAEFEIVPDEVGAVVLVSGEIVGVERAPSAAYFAKVWEPLVRLCYGSLALSAAKIRQHPPATRLPLIVVDKTIDGLRAAMRGVREREERLASTLVSWVKKLQLEACDEADDTIDSIVLRTVAGERFAGQMVTVDGHIAWASLVPA
jgi:hypothetical protein